MTPEQDITRRTLKLLMQDSGIDQREEQFAKEARRLADLIAGESSVAHALDLLAEDTIEERINAERLRTFMYAMQLGLCVIAAHGNDGGLTDEQAKDLHEYLKELAPIG